MADYLTLADIRTAICKAIGDAQESRATEVDYIINQVYLNEILNCDPLRPLHWLLRMDDSLQAKPRATITGITKANPPVVSATAHGFVDGDIVTLYDVTGMTEVEGRTFVVDYDSANAFHLHTLEGSDVDASGYSAAGTAGYAHHRGVKLATTDKTAQKLISLQWDGYPGQFSPIGLDELNDTKTNYWNNSLSMPTRWMPKKVITTAGAETLYLLWFWCPDQAYRLRYWLEFRPARMTADGDIPMLPYRFHPAIIAGAITRLGENKAQVEAGVIWPQIYKMDIEAIREANQAWWREHAPNDRSDIYLL